MAGKGYTIGIGADTKAAKQAIETGLVAPIEDAQDELLKLGKSKGPEQLERSLKDAQKETKDLEKETKKTADAIEKDYKRAYREAKESAEKGMQGSAEATKEFKQEALANLSEVTSSFDGSLDSVTDLVQGTLGGVASSLPGIGLLAGGAAVAVGGIAAAFKANDEASLESETRAAEWADAYIEAGGRILESAQVVEGVRRILADPELYKEAEKNAKNWGVSESTALLAMAGDTNALAEAKYNLAAKQTELEAVDIRAAAATGAGRDALRELETAVREGTEAYDLLTGEMEAGANKADIYSESLRLMAENTKGATKEVDEFGDTVYSLPDGTKVYVDAETGQATQDTDAIEKKIYGLPTKQSFTLEVDTADAQKGIESFFRNNQNRAINARVNVAYGRDRAV